MEAAEHGPIDTAQAHFQVGGIDRLRRIAIEIALAGAPERAFEGARSGRETVAAAGPVAADRAVVRAASAAARRSTIVAYKPVVVSECFISDPFAPVGGSGCGRRCAATHQSMVGIPMDYCQ